MRNIPRLAGLMSWATGGTIAALLTAFVFIWMTDDNRQVFLGKYLVGIENIGISDTVLFTGFLLNLALLSILLYGLYQVLRFFNLYRTGDLFPPGAGGFLARFGVALIFLAPAQILFNSFTSVLFSLHLPEGKKQLAVSISSDNLLLLIVGGLIFMVGHLLNSASAVAEDNRHII